VRQEEEEEEEEPSEPTYSIFGGNDGGSQVIQFQLASMQYVMLNQDSVLYAHPEVRVHEGYESRFLTGPKFDYYEHLGNQPSIYCGAGGPHAGKILPIVLLKKRVPLLVQDDFCLANTGFVIREPVCLTQNTSFR
jgi:hypothetical protein